jgi:hypothetical protein
MVVRRRGALDEVRASCRERLRVIDIYQEDGRKGTKKYPIRV